MKAEEFDVKFEYGEDITQFLDLSQARRPGYEQKRINIDLPIWMIAALEHEANRLVLFLILLLNYGWLNV